MADLISDEPRREKFEADPREELVNTGMKIPSDCIVVLDQEISRWPSLNIMRQDSVDGMFYCTESSDSVKVYDYSENGLVSPSSHTRSEGTVTVPIDVNYAQSKSVIVFPYLVPSQNFLSEYKFNDDGDDGSIILSTC
jgi:hypothetical protein